MPIYEYQCTACDNVFEEWCKCSQMEELLPCPLCSASAKHIISNTAFVLKGTGWYVTEYGNKKSIPDTKEMPKKDESKEKTKDSAADTKSTSDEHKTSSIEPKSSEKKSPDTSAPSSEKT